jgi:long-subunit acyl-CoA synthetase (AMP-forming)
MSKIIRSLECGSEATPDRTVITSSRLSLGWREMHEAVTALSARLRGITSFGMLLENSPAWVIADLAAIHSGIMNVPLPAFFSNEQLRHALQDAQIDTVITDDPDRIASLVSVGGRASLEIAGKHCTLMFLSDGVVTANRHETAKVTYTSGTSGTPRGVRLSQTAIETVSASLVQAAEAESGDRALVLLPLSILLENIGSVYATILAGAEIFVPDPAELGIYGSSRIDAEKLSAVLQRIRPTTLILPPQLLKLLVALGKRQVLPDSFRYIAVGGAPAGIALLDEARALNLPVYQGYGLSEACSVVAVNTPGDNRMGSVGRPLPHTRVRISTDGEIMVLGTSHEGYLNGPPRNPENELATGDLGYLDEDGYLYVTGRCRDRIITSYGRNISPEWVESELTANPLIAQAVVFGNDMPYLTAVLVPAAAATRAGPRTALDRVIREVNARLPDYAGIREYVVAESLFTIESGELTVSGSPRRDVIEKHFALKTGINAEYGHEQFL